MALGRAMRRIVAAVVHALHGVVICALEFPRADAARRHARIEWWAARMLQRLEVRLDVRGQLQPGPVLLLANHVSWLDILAVHAVHAARFVSKADVRRWPLIGYLVAGAGTILIEREKKRDAMRVVHHIAEALREGATVALFPEGTTGAGPVVLPFHANLLQAAIATGAAVQPVVLRYSDAQAPFSGAAQYVGSTTLVQSLARIARARGLCVHVDLLPALAVEGHDRRSLAAEVRHRIQAALDASPR
ncbi:MAG TPA: lysophospholipid acyltransferase family protein [Caldimonas sp.]|nr:lysophospholipid acyltransferase family protein [Caldimonas sp.]